MPRTRTGKIARLPHLVREELNQRLHDNQDGARIIAWVNDKQGLKGSGCVTAQNLSEWRAGGFAEWLEKQDDIERTKRLSEYCLRMSAAGGGTMSLPAAIAGGQLMEVLEGFDPSTLKELLAEKPETYIALLTSLAKLQKSKADERVTEQNDVRLAQSARKLALDEARFQAHTCELFLKWYADKRAAEIAADKSKKPDVKVAELRQLMFGALEEATATE